MFYLIHAVQNTELKKIIIANSIPVFTIHAIRKNF